MLLERGLGVDHTTIYRWIQAYPSSVKLGKLKWLKRLSNRILSVFVNSKNDRKCQSL